MKICQVCRSVYQNDQSFCFNDGSLLVEYDETAGEATLNLPLDKMPTHVDYPPITAGQNRFTNPQNTPSQTKKKSSKAIWAALVLLILAIPLAGLVLGLYAVSRLVQNNRENKLTVSSNSNPFSNKYSQQNQRTKGELKVEIQEVVKGSFGKKYLRCLVTNPNENVIKSPRVSLMLYKNDVKVGTISGQSDLEFLKPNQTIPVWIDVTHKEYTRAEPEESQLGNFYDQNEKDVYPTVTITDAKMSNQTLTSLYNFKPYREVFYKVAGVVTNSDYDEIGVKIYVLFLDEQKHIVGIKSTSPPLLKRGEKAEFTLQTGETSIYGKPASFEIFAVAK